MTNIFQQPLDAEISGACSAVDRAEENSLNRRAANIALDELGDDAPMSALNKRMKEIKSYEQMRIALSYALECLTRPDEVDAVYRMGTIQRIKEELRRGGR